MNDLDHALPAPAEAALDTSPASEPLFDTPAPAEVMAQPSVPEPAITESQAELTEPREGLWRAQTPQMFRYGVLRRALALPGQDGWTDEAQAVESLGLKARAVRGHAFNVKVTFPDDLALASAIMATTARAG